MFVSFCDKNKYIENKIMFFFIKIVLFKIGKAMETKTSMSPNEIADSINVMLVQEKSLARLYSNELSLYVEVNTYNSERTIEYS